MYAAQLRQKPEFKHLKSPTYQINHYSKMQTHQLENLKRDLELKKARQQSTAMRNKLVEHRDKVNYQNELDRIRGELSRTGPRLPASSIARLKQTEEELKKLGAHIAN